MGTTVVFLSGKNAEIQSNPWYLVNIIIMHLKHYEEFFSPVE